MQKAPIANLRNLHWGAGLARGYRNRPDLTRKDLFRRVRFRTRGAFVPTGDLGHLSARRSDRVLGRVDEQIKIRGFRIEPAK